MILLACDIGNNLIKIALYSRDKLADYFSVPIKELNNNLLKGYKFDKAAISSVVPASTNLLFEIIETNFRLQPYIITTHANFNLEIDYDTPETLGIDRICGAEGAFSIFCSKSKSEKLKNNEAIITVDLGTATTVNIILPPNKFAGGIILPGIKMMSKLLNENTVQLPIVNLENYTGVIGKSTVSSITSGIINSTIGGIERVINFLKEKEKIKTVHTYLTGGNAVYIEKRINFNSSFVKDLVLRGVKAVYERNNY